MMELLHTTDYRLGLVTNGERWMLVDAPRDDTTGFISWYASLWSEEPLTLQAFCSLLSVSRFFSVSEDESLEAMLTESAQNQQEVTDQLGFQVRKAVEVLIQSLDKTDQDSNRSLLAEIEPNGSFSIISNPPGLKTRVQNWTLANHLLRQDEVSQFVNFSQKSSVVIVNFYRIL